MTKPILVLHGPNLNLLGTREPEVYGATTLDEINLILTAQAQAKGITLTILQSNTEGTLIDAIQDGVANSSALLINPGGYTHTSVALRDALAAYPHPSIETHMSNTAAREEFRHKSMVSPVVSGTVTGLGVSSYTLGLEWLLFQVAQEVSA